MASSRIIEVPIDNSNDVLEIDCSQLPEHSSEICTILETEGSALRFYYVFALEYYKQEKTEEAIAALKRGLANARANDLTPKVPLLNLLASINVQKAKLATTSGTAEERDMQLKMATALLTESEKISRQEPRTFLVKGLLAMAKRSPDMALQQFNIALKLNPTCVASLLGKARVLFSKRQFQTALGIYQRVLTLHPHGKPDARIGIGLCLLRLGHTKDARRALERAMVANPQSAAPHVLLATMEMNEAKRLMDSKLNPKIDGGEVGEALEEGGKLLNAAMGRLQMAYELQPENAAVLTRLADRLFYSGDYEGTRRLGERALRTGDTPAIRAEAQYQIARAHHAARRFDLAFDAYQKCLASNDKHALARFGLGQMQLQRTDMSSAEATFQRVLEKHPKCVEVLRALGYLHARLPNNKAKAIEYYEREMQAVADDAAEHARRQGKPTGSDDAAGWFDDANLFLEAGLLYETTSARKARKAYSVAAQILQRDASLGDGLPELWNNLGALRQLIGDDRELIFAELDQAVSKCSALLDAARGRLADKAASGHARAAHDVQRLEGTLSTITYNTARFYEHCGLWDRAESLYQRILAATPGYHDARLRLAHIAYYARANSADALALLGQAVQADGKRPGVWLLKGAIELQRKNVQDARRAYEHVLRDISKHDVYALCALGNFHLAAGRSEAGRAATEQRDAARLKQMRDTATASYKRALEFFDKCLVLDQSCAMAAHGAAIAMAERGFPAQARAVFQDVRDAASAGLGSPALSSPAADLVFRIAEDARAAAVANEAPFADMPVNSDVLLWSGVNVAHVYVEGGNYRQAVLAYEACIRRLHETTKALEAAEAVDGSQFVVKGLEPADAAEPEALTSKPEHLTKAELHERRRVERDLRLYLVRALYTQAKATKDVAAMRSALVEIRTLCDMQGISLPEKTEQADDTATDTEAAANSEEGASTDAASRPAERHADRLQPEDGHILFDLALIEQAVAQMVSELPEPQRTLADIDTSASDLKHSTAIFSFLADFGKSPRRRPRIQYSPRLAAERATFGKSLVTKLERKRQEQDAYERERQQHVDQWRRRREEEEAQRRNAEEEAQREQQEREARMLRETEERNALLRQEMADAARNAAAEASTARPRARSQRQPKDDGFISDHDDLADTHSDQETYANARPAPKKSRKRKAQAVTEEEPQDADQLYPDARPVSKKPKKLGLDDSTPDEYGKYKSKAIVSDSDDDAYPAAADPAAEPTEEQRDATPEPRDVVHKPKAIVDSDDDDY